MARAFQEQRSDPCAAARLFATAGHGSFLEGARVDAWFASLEACGGSATEWQEFLDQQPPLALADEARCRRGRLLVARGELAELRSWLEQPELSLCALELLVEAPDTALQHDAARRLAVSFPARLHRLPPAVEAAAVTELGPEELIARASRLITTGLPHLAARELAQQRFKGALESRRRLELARAEVARGRPTEALEMVPEHAAITGEALLVRAEAFRHRGWSSHPGDASRRQFDDCAAAARRAATQLGGALQPQAAALAVECATEAGRPDQALASWRAHRVALRSTPRYDWIGRRLGVALAHDGSAPDAVLELAKAMPDQERCLRYWAAVAAGEERSTILRELAELPIRDLYGRWAAGDTDRRQELALAAPLGDPATPASVAWLLQAGLEGEAAREWQRLGDSRALAPREALAAAAFQHHRGRSDLAIRLLRSAFPELGDVTMAAVPADVLRAYLPLRWADELTAAAQEHGLAPWLLAGLARQESIFVAHARSPRGALGVLQLIPSTARVHARALGLGASPDLRDPAVNLRLGARELASLIARFGEVEPALAAYNAGPNRAARWWQQNPERRLFTEAVPIPETYTYIRRVSFLAEAYRGVYAEQWSNAP